MSIIVLIRHLARVLFSLTGKPVTGRSPLTSLQNVLTGTVLASLTLPNPAFSQPAFPPPALATATTVEAAMGILGVARPEANGYLLLDLPDVAPAGKVRGAVSSEIPGTSQVILLRGAPAALTVGGQSPRLTTAGGAPPPTDGQPPASVLIAAERIAPGAAAKVALQIDIPHTQWFTLLSFAQGRWFIATREVKVGKGSNPVLRATQSPAAKPRAN